MILCTYDAQVSQVEEVSELSKLNGIKERSVLNELEYFHILMVPQVTLHKMFLKVLLQSFAQTWLYTL